MDLTSYVFQADGKIAPSYGVSVIVLSFISFQVLRALVKPSIAPKSSHSEFLVWRSYAVSWIHSCVVTVWNIICFYLYWGDVLEDLVGFYNLSMYTMVAFSTGYFINDFVDCCITVGAVQMWEVLLHHCGVIGIFMYNLATCKCLAYSMVALIVEINTIFLHGRKLLQKHPLPHDHWLYRMTVWSNLISFVAFRFVPLAVLCHGVYILSSCTLVSPAYVVVLSTSIVVMVVINPIFFYRLIKNDIFRFYKNKRKAALEKKHSSNNNNNNENSFVVADKSQTNELINRKAGSA